jgi:hypothetical protein
MKTPVAEARSEWIETQQVSPDRVVLADAKRADDAIITRWNGRDHRDGDVGSNNNSIRPKEARALKPFGSAIFTAQFGKCHEVPVWEVSPVLFHQWPTGSGFERYGFVGGEANQYYPGLYEGTTAVIHPRAEDTIHANRGPRRPGDHLDSSAKALMPDKPFFVYFAPRAHHAPPTYQAVVG